jgi:hypothetical protein
MSSEREQWVMERGVPAIVNAGCQMLDRGSSNQLNIGTVCGLRQTIQLQKSDLTC